MSVPEKTTKIALSGSLCSGKTTLLERHADSADYGFTVVEEQARRYFEQHEPPDRLDFEVQETLVGLIQEAEHAAHENGGIILCDRAVVDSLAYLYAAGRKVEAETIMDERICMWLPTYDRLLLCDIDGIPMVGDSIRTEDAAFRERLHDAFIEAFEDFGIPYEKLSGTSEQRAARLTEVVLECHADETA